MHRLSQYPILAILLASFFLAACGGPEPITPVGENIICFGDSLTFGTGAPSDKSYPAQLAEMLGQPVINSGVPGDTTAWGQRVKDMERNQIFKGRGKLIRLILEYWGNLFHSSSRRHPKAAPS